MTTVLSLLLLLLLVIEVVMRVRVGYNELYEVTRFNELMSTLFIAPHCQMVSTLFCVLLCGTTGGSRVCTQCNLSA